MDKPLPDDYARELRGDGFEEMNQSNYGFSKFFEQLMAVVAIIGTTFLGWLCVSLVSVERDVAVLKDRPPPVSQELFNMRMESFDKRLIALEQRK